VFLIVFAYFVFFAPNYGPPGQLHPGQPAGDAGAHRAGMVLPAVLRDPARHPGQAGRRAAMFGAIAVLFVLPWLDTSPIATSPISA
jgi:ubiquinol-cytochrome c reductase cytochrome b/c1 subunit